MLITDKTELKNYSTPYRIWQGIPGIAITQKGRIFSAFYSGGTKEEEGNYVVLLKSDDDGKTFSEPITVVFNKEGGRCFDEVIWIDPKGRLWLCWAYMGKYNEGEYASVCEDPDADELVWSEPRLIGNDIMMCKPTVLTSGEWLFPIAVWEDWLRNLNNMPPVNMDERKNKQKGAFAYFSSDNGKTFIKKGGIIAKDRSFDEHMITELSDGRLMMLIRTTYGIAVSFSYDRGVSWTNAQDSKIGGPCSRFSITRLKSGRHLLINHYNFNGRNNLTALLSDDDCKTFKYSLLLDERSQVSYPDIQEHNGYIYITYDRERGGFKPSLDVAYADAREVLFAKITEEDIINGKIVSKDGKLKQIISKLGKYAKEYENPYGEYNRFSEVELAKFLMEKHPDNIVEKIFDYYQVGCENMHKVQCEKMDELVEQLNEKENKLTTIVDIITLVRSVTNTTKESIPVVELVKKMISSGVENLSEIAEKTGVSKCYLQHVFKKQTGTTITEYKNSQKLTKAKVLLITTDKTITDIATECGFENSSYFAELFRSCENVPPSEYRKLNK
ncbi:MAG: helix-turn-helix domain-containing protein [Clostridiales bacterium]|nr:helix-turn-helix domain-containing protein [Clostridiales bacterium]